MNWTGYRGTDGRASKQESRARRLKPRFWWTEEDLRWRRLLDLGKSGRLRPSRPKTGRMWRSGFCRFDRTHATLRRRCMIPASQFYSGATLLLVLSLFTPVAAQLRDH